ncbi:MAG: HAD family phosphatase [Nitrospiria bacterium]
MRIPSDLRAVLFDFDGVIVDSEPIHFRLFREVLAAEDIELTRKTYDQLYLGMDDRECFTAVLEAHGRPAPPSKVASLIEQKSMRLMGEVDRQVPLLPGAAACIRSLAASLPLAICSGALRPEIEAMLKQAGLLTAFLGIVSAEDVAHGKPHPEGYRAALALVNRAIRPPAPIEPSAVLVIEDSLAGIEAARAAGMRCLAVTNSYSMTLLKAAGADAVVTTLEGEPLASLPDSGT